MKTKIEIESELVDLHHHIDKLRERETHGFSEVIQHIEETKADIRMLEWVLGNKITKDKDKFIEEVKQLAVDFWRINLHNGTFEKYLIDLTDKYLNK